MQHIQLPNEPVIGDIEIPYLCNEPYDGGDFMTYPERQGWSMKVLIRGVTFVHHGDIIRDGSDIAPFLQSWLYFGLLNEVLGRKVDQDEYRYTSRMRQTLLTSATLEKDVVEWTKHFLDNVTEMYDDEILAWRAHLKACFRRVQDLLYASLAYQHDHPEHRSQSLTLVWLGIATLAEYLHRTLRLFWEELDDAVDPLFLRSINLPSDPDVAGPIIEKMVQNSWCPKMCNHVQTEKYGSIAKLWFCANLNPPNAGKSHRECTMEICQEQQVHRTNYKTIHMSEDCDCTFLGPDADTLRNLIERDEIALTTVDRSGPNKTTSVNVQGYTPSTVYIAISHVWSDGRGNLQENTLPECVLQYIQRCVNFVCKPQSATIGESANVPFWMDTLSLPRTPAELRQRSILRIPDAFKQAAKVLVFDAYLGGTEMGRIKPTEMIARISICPWTQRLWTAAEGLLAKSIFVQFRDRSFDLAELANYQREESEYFPPTLSRLIFWEILEIYYSNRGLSYLRDEFSSPSVFQLRSGLRMRATSWLFDEPICLSILLHLDVTAIVQSEHTEKMAAFWKLLGVVPRSLAFSTTRKLTQKGYRWAPASFLGDLDTTDWTGPRDLADQDHARVTSEGLVVRLPALLFKFGQPDSVQFQAKQRLLEHMLNFDMRFVLQDQNGFWYDCDASQKWNEDTCVSWPVTKEPAILLARSPSVIRHNINSGPTFSTPVINGIVVLRDNFEPEQSTTACQALALLTIAFMSPEEGNYWDELKTLARRITDDFADEVKRMLERSEDLFVFAARCIEGYGLGITLLRLMKRVFEFKGWPTSHEAMSLRCYRNTIYLLLVEQCCQVDERSDSMSWCID